MLYIQREDCGGGPVISTAKARDGCGVCGGDGTSCLDCKGEARGAAVLECGVCHDTAEVAARARDCAGACSVNTVVTVAGDQVL